jgi:predicted DNA-binding WGR domain protein
MHTTLILIDPSVNARKFYTVEVSWGTVRCHWGRIGTAGQKSVKQFASTAAAHVYAVEKLAQKLAKGYERVSA